jgi:hypothetical protein
LTRTSVCYKWVVGLNSHQCLCRYGGILSLLELGMHGTGRQVKRNVSSHSLHRRVFFLFPSVVKKNSVAARTVSF